MSKSVTIKYRVFLCASRRDSWWSDRVAAALRCHAQELSASKSSAGRGPGSLHVFQDQAASDDICPDQKTLAALAASKSMVVICSRHAAKSKYMNEQIRQFKLRRGCDRIIPVIVDGHSRDLDHECLPPALRFKFGPDGILTWEHEALIEIDVRLKNKGEEAAQHKIAARVLVVHVDEVVRGCALNEYDETDSERAW